MEPTKSNRPIEDEALLRALALELDADLMESQVAAQRKAARRYYDIAHGKVRKLPKHRHASRAADPAAPYAGKKHRDDVA